MQPGLSSQAQAQARKIKLLVIFDRQAQAQAIQRLTFKFKVKPEIFRPRAGKLILVVCRKCLYQPSLEV